MKPMSEKIVSMKNTSILIFALLCSLQTMAINLVIQQTDGAQQLQDIALIGKWVFVGEELQLLDKAGNLLASEVIADIRKITFSASSITTVENAVENSIMVYPNPTQDILFVNGIEAQALRVYDLQGRMLHTENGTQISVSHLPMGTYLLQIGTQVLRFIKQ